VRAKKATLKLTEHKTIAWVADDREMADEVAGWFADLKIPQLDKLAMPSSVPHFHYRPAKSRDRAKLCDELYRQRMRRIARIGVQTPRQKD
jgi:hypothetical protein